MKNFHHRGTQKQLFCFLPVTLWWVISLERWPISKLALSLSKGPLLA